MNQTPLRRSPVVLSLLAVSLFLAGGCAEPKITPERVRSDLSPGLETLAESREQRLNRHAKTWDVNTRQIWDDVDAILFDDHPMRLTRYPVP